MTDELNERLAAWVAPPPSEAMRLRIEELLSDGRLSGPCAAKPSRMGLLSVTYASAVGLLLLLTAVQQPASRPALTRHDLELRRPLVVAPGLPAASQTAATAVSAVELEGFQAIDHPRIHVNRSTP